MKNIEPPHQTKNNLAHLRSKIDNQYDHEPSLASEVHDLKIIQPQSIHQQYIEELTKSGQSLADIQTAWHNYYASLDDAAKHQVWQEFYSAHAASLAKLESMRTAQTASKPTPSESIETKYEANKIPRDNLPSRKIMKLAKKVPGINNLDNRTVAQIKAELLNRLGGRLPERAKPHLSAAFKGISLGFLALLIMTFGLINERIIAPFITPSRQISSTNLIIDINNSQVDPTPKLIIPKINLEIPVNFELNSTNENDIQRALESAAVQFPTTVKPGQNGNGAIFGHSSNNILNRGQYKFAFLLLKKLETGDTFIIHYQSRAYYYRVFDKQVVESSNVGVLEQNPKPATYSLITCDPPGTSQKRLVVWGEQISPLPQTNVATTVSSELKKPSQLPSNAPTIWSRIKNWLL